MFKFNMLTVAVALSAMVSTAEASFVLAPGGSIDPLDFETTGEVVGADPGWFGTSLGVYSRSARETRDGIDDFDNTIIEDLYDVTGVIDVAVWRAAVGDKLTFQYGFTAFEENGVDGSGVQIFRMRGFAGYDLELGWSYDQPYFSPLVSRSLDGDTITVDYYEHDFLTSEPIGTLLVRMMAPTFQLSGTGNMDIHLDTFGVIPNEVRLLPAPSEIPIPVPAALLAGGLGLLGALRLRKA